MRESNTRNGDARYTAKGDPEKYDQHPSVDDWMDASGYFINRKWPVRKPAIDLDIRFN